MMHSNSARRMLPVCLLLALLGCLLLLRNHIHAHNRPASVPRAPQLSIPELIAQIDAHQSPEASPYMNTARVALDKTKLDAAPKWLTPDEKLDLEYQYARELLDAGKTDAALTRFQSMEREIQTAPPLTWPT